MKRPETERCNTKGFTEFGSLLENVRSIVQDVFSDVRNLVTVRKENEVSASTRPFTEVMIDTTSDFVAEKDETYHNEAECPEQHVTCFKCKGKKLNKKNKPCKKCRGQGAHCLKGMGDVAK